MSEAVKEASDLLVKAMTDAVTNSKEEAQKAFTALEAQEAALTETISTFPAAMNFHPWLESLKAAHLELVDAKKRLQAIITRFDMHLMPTQAPVVDAGPNPLPNP